MKKPMRIGVVFLIIILSFIFLMPNFQASSDSDYSHIRVKLSISTSSISIVLNGEYKISDELSSTLNPGAYTLSLANNNKIRIQGKGIDKVVGSSLTFLRQTNSINDQHLTIKGTDYGNINYLGDMVFSLNSGKIMVVNHVPLEQYLYGVVAYEMSNSFPLEALKSQAVCARGYAIRTISSSGTYDLGDTTAHQVYKGYNPSYKRVIQAVDETKGQVLTYKGRIISTYYAASNGGQTELPGNTWGGGSTKNKEYSYLAQKDDPYDLENPSSLYQRIFVPRNVVGSEHDAVASDLPGDYIVRIVPALDYCNIRKGAGTNYEVLGKAYLGTSYQWIASQKNDKSETWHKIDFDGKEGYIRSDLGIKSQNGRYLYENPVLADLQTKAFHALTNANKKISTTTDVKVITVNSLSNGKERWPGTGSRSYVTANANVTIQYMATGSNSLSNKEDVNVVMDLMKPAGGGGYLNAHDYLNSNLRLRGVSGSKDGYYITNGRYGHGVGMSQRGAQTMAGNHNKTHREILEFYFEGTTLTNLDTSIPAYEETPKLSSSKYVIKGNTITGLSTNLKVSTFTSNITKENAVVQWVSANGKAKTSETLVTGDVLQLKYLNSGKIYKNYSMVIYGDINADGDISIIDLLRIQKHLLNTNKLTGPYLTAADTTKDGSVTILDLLRIQKHLLGTTTIKQ